MSTKKEAFDWLHLTARFSGADRFIRFSHISAVMPIHKTTPGGDATPREVIVGSAVATANATYEVKELPDEIFAMAHYVDMPHAMRAPRPLKLVNRLRRAPA